MVSIKGLKTVREMSELTTYQAQPWLERQTGGGGSRTDRYFYTHT